MDPEGCNGYTQMSARIWWLGDVQLGAGDRGVDGDLHDLREKWLKEREERKATVQRDADAIRASVSTARGSMHSGISLMSQNTTLYGRDTAKSESSQPDDEVFMRLKRRREELHRTEVYTVNSLTELLEKLHTFKVTLESGGGSNFSTAGLRKRDMVREALVGSVTSVTSLLGGVATKRPDASVDPYSRMSLPRGLLPVNEVENSLTWDIKVLKKTIKIAKNLLPVHERLRNSLERANMQDYLEPVWQAFYQVKEELKVGCRGFRPVHARACVRA